MAEYSLGSPATLTSSNIQVAVVPLPAPSGDSVSFTPFSSSSLSLELPSSLVHPHLSDLMIIVENSRSIYSPLKAHSFRPASGVVSLNYYVDGAATPVTGLSSPILIEIPLLISSPSVKNLIEAVFSSSPSTSKDQVLATKELHCAFYNQASQTLSEDGCAVADFSPSSVTCACTHMTDFMAFLSSSLDTLQGSNYSALLALGDLSMESLSSNLGVFFSLVYFSSFIVLAGLSAAADFTARSPKAQNKVHNL